MNLNNYKFHAKLVPQNYLKLALEAQKHKEVKLTELLEKRKLPEEGWTDELVRYITEQLAALDSNNFDHKSGVGEREARIVCKIIAQRHYNFGHGIGRSGDLLEAQPKAVGSTLLAQLTNSFLLDLIRLQGIKSCQSCFLVPMATGMTLTLCLLSLRKQRPQAKYVLWSRIDQKSCFKSIITAGLTPLIIHTIKREGEDGLFTDIEDFRQRLNNTESNEILCIMSTSSCFAPRNCDNLIQLSELAKSFEIPHIINNAYGLQSTFVTHQIEQANRRGRVDLIVQSTDKNLMVPVGGAVVAGFQESIVRNVATSYAGRASSSPSLDVFITLLSLGKKGYQELVQQRKTNFSYLQQKLEEFAQAQSCRLLKTKWNSISMALTLDSLSESQQTKLGSMLFTRGVYGARVITPNSNITIDGVKFCNWGSHERGLNYSYLTVAASLGIQLTEIDNFMKKLENCWHELQEETIKTT